MYGMDCPAPSVTGNGVPPKVIREARRYLTELENESAARAQPDLFSTPVVIQHEMDHLEGVLFIDHLSKLKRDIILRKMTKAKKRAAAG